MALYNNVPKINYFCRCALAVSSNKWLKCFIRSHTYKPVVLDGDIIDDFTTQLMERKLDKWEIRREKQMLRNKRYRLEPNLHTKQVRLNITYMNATNLDTLLKDSIEMDNISYIKEIINECVKHKRLPTVPVLLQTLYYCSENGDKDLIVTIAEICGEIQPEILKNFSDFKHYIARTIWMKGNVNSAIAMFEDVYRSNLNLRRIVRCMLKQLLLDAVTKHSEAALVNMIHFAKRLMKDFKDFYPLACIWQACFLSEWFTDQTIALELLEENEGLLNVVSSHIPFVVMLSLKKHQIDVVYRLLEFLLRLEQKSECTRIVEALFDYRVSQSDLRGCSEIVKWSIKQGIDVQVFKNESFINFLLSYVSDPTVAAYINLNSNQSRAKRVYQFKF